MKHIKTINKTNIKNSLSEIDRYFIFIIADILLEEIRTAVDFLSARFENAVRQRNDRILVEINNVFQLLGELF